uniref:Endonuclease/exonuclease/phosphatase domain-containing protein n=1 Tax=Octactis speculum TaxID=3111310 RepID=A0A7S2CN77_9STRA|mmetsp:Transcript_37987/g.51388  ORF Transcript_37987/g.51388 Transcript_37987/m.51388 type:complete len:338 (+) Transcript_37987:90-1103(+)
MNSQPFRGCAVEMPGLQSIVVERPEMSGCYDRNSSNRHAGRGQTLRVATWNLLAPPYFRVGGGKRESAFPGRWKSRLAEQVRVVQRLDADVVLLQEFWFDEPQVFEFWRSHFSADYAFFGSQRTRSKADGVLTMVRHAWLDADTFEMRTISFDDWGDRVANVLQLGKSLPTIVNTHFTFPHGNAHDTVMRTAQARKLSEYLLTSWPGEGSGSTIVIGGDLNGDINDPACRLLHEKGFTPHTRDPFVSHVSHRGDHMGCDFVMVYSPLEAPCEERGGGILASDAEGGEGKPCRLAFEAHDLVGRIEEIGSDAWSSDHLAVTAQFRTSLTAAHSPSHHP